jgi:hypothetical protein
MTRVVGNRQMAEWLMSRIPRAANADYAEGVQRTTLAQRQEPVGKYARVYKDNSLAGATVRVRNLARLDLQRYHPATVAPDRRDQCSKNVELCR